ncbi:uncharacterized protein J8A68_001641 [[Candida] subhashii]|uniref:Uncharacterized protein n=1 Tax=[Candida] subhashii TaxID=561895 RepID=A0A8J5QNK2_9ASCO|nr:uncharacterized protein J8A68_001641 [[Candida] subhashii]KAG7664824.1 hypothetical protein J8A68_001641 [[Candida] subhashii]
MFRYPEDEWRRLGRSQRRRITRKRQRQEQRQRERLHRSYVPTRRRRDRYVPTGKRPINSRNSIGEHYSSSYTRLGAFPSTRDFVSAPSIGHGTSSSIRNAGNSPKSAQGPAYVPRGSHPTRNTYRGRYKKYEPTVETSRVPIQEQFGDSSSIEEKQEALIEIPFETYHWDDIALARLPQSDVYESDSDSSCKIDFENMAVDEEDFFSINFDPYNMKL